MPIRRLLALMLVAASLLALPGGAQAAPAPERTTLGGEGTVLYFQRYVGEDDSYHYQLWALHSDGDPTAVLTDPWFKPFAADLSPDGRKVAMTVGPGSTVTANGIYVVGIDGSGRRNIIAGNGKLTEARDPDWSPDGKRLVFVGVDKDIHYDLWTVNVDGTGLTRLTTCNCAWENTPKWSPDGTEVLWSPSTYDLSILDVATRQTRVVYDNALSGNVNVQSADWSPDGQTVVFSATESWNTVPLVLRTMPVGGGTPTKLGLDDQMSYATPMYSPDGGRIAFTRSQSTYDEYYSGLGSVEADGPYNIVAIHSDGLTDEIASWEAECDCRPGGRFSSLSLHAKTMAGAIQVSGGLLPGVGGQKIKLVIQKKPNQTWQPLQTTTVTTSPEAIYYAEMKRAAGKLCRVTATWAGDAGHDPARARTKPFSC